MMGLLDVRRSDQIQPRTWDNYRRSRSAFYGGEGDPDYAGEYAEYLSDFNDDKMRRRYAGLMDFLKNKYKAQAPEPVQEPAVDPRIPTNLAPSPLAEGGTGLPGAARAYDNAPLTWDMSGGK